MSDDGSEQFPPGWVPDAAPVPRRRPTGNRRWVVPLAVLGVVAVVVAAVLIVTDDEPSPATVAGTSTPSSAPAAPAPPSGDPTAIASATDTGPVKIIASDMTCQPWREIQSTVASAQSGGWDQRDPSIPGAAWTPQLKAQYEQVGTALRAAADQAVALARQTPNRVLRELYEVFTAYGRAYAAALTNYQPPQDAYARANTAALQAISEICAAADGGSAITRATQVPPAAPPTAPAPAGDPANPERFIPQAGPTCARWVPAEGALATAVQPWLDLNPDVPVAQWTPDQRAALQSAAAQFTAAATTLEADGRGSGTPQLEDFAVLAAQYFRAFNAAVPNYSAADRNLGMVGLRLDTLVSSACQAAAAG
ncbi:hypothetical protein [Mycolicibacterium arenosum]|uniref:Uncharacterized protein n=1 Tax=Mycolicibacterium arenosum TaxID=2952157 RepID=A0ABT1MGQ2_9MYCO|nr:hypothetical protein [Mycolicibacterium sp. CAU 1645]MCP9276942.1 hypothetical protein [Mycolicibacterium sp. CAU 1645]